MTELNEEQRECIDFESGIANVLAVPGSGKTLTMTYRISHLVNSGIAPESILGLTFTRNAAQAMRERLNPVLGNQASRVMLCTIHSFCHWILRSEGKTFDMLFGKEQIRFIRKLIQRFRLRNFPTGTVLQEISLAKCNLINLEEFRELYNGDDSMQKLADIYEAYDHEKEKKMLLDFDDLLVQTYWLLAENQDTKEKYQNKFKHIMVDEFQDTNPAQLEILKLLLPDPDGVESSFWVCGDDWQSIYAFTGASVGNILNFKKVFPGAREFILSVNYRSTPQILQTGQNLIQHNTRKADKEIRANHQDGEEVIVLECQDEDDEAKQLINEITDLVQRRSFNYRDIAVLYRANFQSRPLEEAFSQNKIPYHIENGTNFFQRFEVKILLDYMRLIENPESEEGDEALRSVINIPSRYIGRRLVQELEDFCLDNQISLFQGLKEMPVHIPYLRKNIKSFRELVEPLMRDKENMEPTELLSILREGLDFDRVITDDDIPSPDDNKIANLNQLQKVASKYSDHRSLLEYADSFEEEMSQDENGVSLMTIHKAKGLEFPVVFLVGLVEGILPTKKGDTEEERRITFVGLSRAKRLLYVSYCRMYLGQPVKKSIFLDEMMEQ